MIGVGLYVVKGFWWVLFDYYVYKNPYGNFSGIVGNILGWPFLSLYKTFHVLKKKWYNL